MTSAATGKGDSTERLPIVQYWDRPAVPSDVAELFATVDEHNAGRPHLVFDASSAQSLIAERLGRREVAAFDACAVAAMQADYFRYCAVYALGGIWLDADCRCLADVGSLLRPGRGMFVEGAGGRVNNWALIFGVKRHPVLRLAIDVATTNIEHRLFDKIRLVTGPGILTALIGIAHQGTSQPLFESIREWSAADDPERRGQVEAYRESLRTAIGDGTSVVEAFETVEVAPASLMEGLVRHGSSHLEYKSTEAHFPNFRSSIYR